MERPDRTDEDIVDKVKVFSSDDEKLKVLGELLSNNTSRDIIRLLIKKEMYTNEIARKLELSRNLVSHHLQKMESIGILDVTKKKIIRKGKEHRFFKIPSGMLILPEKSDSETKNGFLKKIFKEGIKISAVFLAVLGVSQFFQAKEIPETNRDNRATPDIGLDSKITENIPSASQIDVFWLTLISIISIIAISSIVIILIKKRKRWFNR